MDKRRDEARGQVLSSSGRTLKNEFVLFFFFFLLQDEDMQIRKRKNLPDLECQARSTGELG